MHHPRKAILSLAICGFVAAGIAQTNSSTGNAPNTIHISAQSQVEKDADLATAQFVVSGRDGQLKQAYAKAEAQSEQLRSLLTQQGFMLDQAHLGSYTVQPNMNYPSRKVADYTVAANMTLEITDFSKIGPLVEAAGSLDAALLRNVTFSLKDMEAAKTEALVEAYRQSRREADALAEAAGRHISALDSASVDVTTGGGIRPMMMAGFDASGRAAAPAPTEDFTPHQITVSARVDAVYRLAQ